GPRPPADRRPRTRRTARRRCTSAGRGRSSGACRSRGECPPPAAPSRPRRPALPDGPATGNTRSWIQGEHDLPVLLADRIDAETFLRLGSLAGAEVELVGVERTDHLPRADDPFRQRA